MATSSHTQETDMHAVTLTPSACAHFRKTLLNNPDYLGVRLGVKKSGCSGLAYTIDFAGEITPRDVVFFAEDIQVVVDKESLTYLKGMQVDCVQEGLNHFLKFNNPNVKGACGCGESFSVTEKEENRNAT